MAQQLGETYHSAIAEMRTIGLSHSAGEKLARFLLDLSADRDEGKGEVKLTLTPYTRRDRPDDRGLPRDRDAAVRRVQEKVAFASNRFDAYYQE